MEDSRGISHWLVLELFRSSVVISDLRKGVNTKISKFAGDTRLFWGFFWVIDCCANVEGLQRVPTKMSGWRGGSCALVENYKVMHLGKTNVAYMILRSELVTSQESHLGVSINSSLKALAWCTAEDKEPDNVNLAVNTLNKLGVCLGKKKNIRNWLTAQKLES